MKLPKPTTPTMSLFSFSSLLLLLLAATPLAYADATFSSPAAGTTLTSGTAITITWAESNTAPLMTDLSTFNLILYTGSNASPVPLTTLKAGGTFPATTLTVTIPSTIGGPSSSTTATYPYFLGLQSTAKAGGTVTNYSGRFALSGMTGVFSSAVLTALQSVSGSAGPATLNQVAAAAAPAAGAAQYSVPYNSQTGLIRYASMQPSPPTKITATNTAPLYPSSSVSIATTFLPIPSIQTTITQAPAAQTFVSHANTASPAPMPQDDMQKFLNRWKD